MFVVKKCFLLLYQNMLICNAGYAGKVDVLLDDEHQHVIGSITAYHGQFPWQAALRVENSFFCGGSLITSHWVLTAAHCA
jgi:secreted trypsin-like serine protease